MDTTLHHHFHFLRLAFGLFIILGIVNFAVLDLQAFKILIDQRQEMNARKQNIAIVSPVPTVYPTTSPEILTPTLSLQSISTPQQNTSVKEFFIPFGSGSSMAIDWTDVAALQATVDTSQYGKIKQAIFEASLRI